MSITRREFVTGAAAVGAGALLSKPNVVRAAESKPDAASFNFVHLTDMHVTFKRKGGVGWHTCVEHVRGLKTRPAFALMGGDLAFDGNYHTKSDFAEFVRLYKEGADGLGIPYHNCMGNHDPLGYGGRRKVAIDDPDIGKKMIMDRLEWPKSYYSFDHGGWHFVVLDSIFTLKGSDGGPTYEPRIGPEQLEWLAYDLGAAGGKPTVAVTHIAAFCNIGQMNGVKDHPAMDGMQVWDTKELRTILERHKVKALLQGHSHRIEQYCLNDVWYLTSAAVSGAWWAGSWVGSAPGYTLFHCKGDELTWEHVSYPWEPHLEPEDDLERKKIAEQKAFEAEQQRLLERERAGRKS